MKSTVKRGKLRLGKKTETGYDFSSKIDFKDDLSKQIEKVMREKKANDDLELEIRKIEKYITALNKQSVKKDLTYYYNVGKYLLFLDRRNFGEISQYSVYRRIVEEIPQILPHLKEEVEVARKHLETMYRLAHVKEDLLNKISWDQWYEIMKFKGLYKNAKALKNIIKLIESKKISGPELRLTISKLK